MRSTAIVFFAVLVLEVPALLFAGEISQSALFSVSDLKFAKIGEYDVIRIPGCELSDALGEPQVPVSLVQISVPADAEIEGVTVTRTESEELPGTYHLYPSQPQQVLSKFGSEDVPFLEPKTAVYNLTHEYPGRLVEFTGNGSMGGYGMASFFVYPVQYLPSEGKIRLNTRIDFTVSYTSTAEKSAAPQERSAIAERLYRDLSRKAVSNPEMVDSDQSPLGNPYSEGFEYLVVTSDAYASAFAELADWKTKKGVPAVVRTLSWIEANHSGRDTQEKIRNYLKHAYVDSGLVWLLLGGDTDVVPDRVAYAMTCEAHAGEDEDSLRADLYYSDLDGDWNFNGNGTFGEIGDSVDLYPELFVGRAPVNSLSEAETFVEKIITYEKNPPTDYQLDALFMGEILWSNPYTDGGVGKNQIDSLYVPPRFDPITKLYESLGNENYTTVMNALQEGQSLVNHDGHGWIDYMGVGQGHLEGSDMDALTNGSRLGIFYSIGCWVGAIHYDAVSEHFITNPNGGGVAFIANTSYGWGSPGNPGFGCSDRFDHTFYEKLFHDDLYHIGLTLAADKIHYIPKSRQENVYRWHQYQLNLLGDPEMPIWTDTPDTLEVVHSDTAMAGQSAFLVTVRRNSNPLGGALVCLLQGTDLYERAYTHSNGQAEFELSSVQPGEMYVTVTQHNFLPYEGTVTIKSTGKWIQYSGHTVVDTAGGNGDSTPNPGEVIQLSVEIENLGDQTVSDVAATLKGSNSLITLLDSTAVYGGQLEPDSTATEVFSFSISNQATNGFTTYLTLILADGEDEWTEQIGIVVAAPILECLEYMVADTVSGDGDGIPEPGEDLVLTVPVSNSGLGTAYATTADVTTADPHVEILSSHTDCGDITPDSSVHATFTVRIQSSSPDPHFADLEVSCTTGVSGYLDTLVLSIGTNGFSDDMESGEGGWLPSGGMGGAWHLTAHRYHSDTHSWYCGLEDVWTYSNFARIWLESPSFILGPNSCLSFWQWCEFTNYGVDGVYVELISTSGAVDTLDFIGSGGALDSILSIGNDWIQEKYDLSSYPVGDTFHVRFTFASDQYDIAEGLYLDDLRIGSWLDPQIYVNSSEIGMSVNQGGQSSETLGIHNFGGDYLNFYLQVRSAAKDLWLTVAPTYGIVAPDDSMRVEVMVDASGLAEGSYSAEITATSDDPHRPTFTIPVTLDVFLDETAPSVAITSPNGAENWACGSTQEIQWMQSDDVGVASDTIYYSTDGGSSWTYVWGGPPTTAYLWTVPDDPSDMCRVKVIAVDGSNNLNADISDADFTIDAAFACGDCNADGRVTVADANYLVGFIYRNGDEPVGEADVNVDSRITIADANYLVTFIYRAGPAPCEPLVGGGETRSE